MSAMTGLRDIHPEIRGLILFASVSSLLLDRLVNVSNLIDNVTVPYASRTGALISP